jgi:hypothetical protein
VASVGLIYSNLPAQRSAPALIQDIFCDIIKVRRILRGVIVRHTGLEALGFVEKPVAECFDFGQSF